MLRREEGAGSRRAKAMQGMFLQGLLATVVLLFAFLSQDDPRVLGLTLWTLVVPAGFGTAYWTAYRRGEAARASGAWTPQAEAAEARRLVRWMGLTLMAWIGGLAAVWLLVG